MKRPIRQYKGFYLQWHASQPGQAEGHWLARRLSVPWGYDIVKGETLIKVKDTVTQFIITEYRDKFAAELDLLINSV